MVRLLGALPHNCSKQNSFSCISPGLSTMYSFSRLHQFKSIRYNMQAITASLMDHMDLNPKQLVYVLTLP